MFVKQKLEKNYVHFQKGHFNKGLEGWIYPSSSPLEEDNIAHLFGEGIRRVHTKKTMSSILTP